MDPLEVVSIASVLSLAPCAVGLTPAAVVTVNMGLVAGGCAGAKVGEKADLWACSLLCVMAASVSSICKVEERHRLQLHMSFHF